MNRRSTLGVRAGVRRARASILAVLLLLVFAPRVSADALDDWLQTERTVAVSKLVGNILPNGAVIASPSKSDPNYYYHWVRDGALTMDVVVSLYTNTKNAEKLPYLALLNAYLDFSLANQITTNPSSGWGRGLGEPKFNTDGSAYQGPWGRPQDDGPALRALTFTRLANLLLDAGDPDQIKLVKTKLYDGVFPTNSVIKRDLEYVSHNWQNTCFDLWEEASGHHFYTRMAQRRALIEGAKLANRLGDPKAGDWYSAQATALEAEIQKHWDATRGIIIAMRDLDAGINYKSSGLDAAVILGALHAGGDDFFGPTNDMVLATASSLMATFNKIYDINNTKTDPADGALGVAIGRYPEDRYGGHEGTTEGNPWVLCTLALGELFLRAADDWQRQGQITLTDRNVAFFSSLNAAKLGSLSSGQVLMPNDQGFKDIISELSSAADRQLRRVKYHANPDGSLSEQMNRHTGFMQSAYDLTWNYAAVLTCLAHRSSAIVPVALKTIRPASPWTLNRGGILILDRKSRSADPAKRLPSVPGSVAELRQRVAELEAAVQRLTREQEKNTTIKK
jgi:glucoamylase